MNSFLISTLCMNNGKLSSHIVNSWIHSKILVLKMGCDCPRQCVYVVSVVQIYPIFSHSKSSHVITFLSWYHLLQLHHCFSSILHHWWAAATLMAVCSMIYAICQHEHFPVFNTAVQLSITNTFNLNSFCPCLLLCSTPSHFNPVTVFPLHPLATSVSLGTAGSMLAVSRGNYIKKLSRFFLLLHKRLSLDWNCKLICLYS